jgi:hypothetical protein
MSGMLHGMESANFKLTSTDSDQVNASFAVELLATLQIRDREITRKRPILVSWPMRLPVSLHRQLKKAAKKHGVTMASIANEALARVLPVLLSPPELTAAAKEVDLEE